MYLNILHIKLHKKINIFIKAKTIYIPERRKYYTNKRSKRKCICN